jgi:hypothetical protein
MGSGRGRGFASDREPCFILVERVDCEPGGVVDERSDR